MKSIRWREVFMIVLGSFLLATSIYHIHVQNNLAEGGFIGIALLIKNFFHISPSITTLFLDIPLIILGTIFIGKRLAIKAIIGAMSFSASYSLMEHYSPFVINLSQHLFIAAVIGGVLVGFALGLILRNGGATGGDDILSLLLSKCSRLSIGKIYIIFDTFVLALSTLYMNWVSIAYTILSVAICGFMTDFVLEYHKQDSAPKAIKQDASTKAYV